MCDTLSYYFQIPFNWKALHNYRNGATEEDSFSSNFTHLFHLS